MSNLNNLQDALELVSKEVKKSKELLNDLGYQYIKGKEHNESLTAKLTNVKIISEARLNTMNNLKERNRTLNNQMEEQAKTIRSDQENLRAKDRRILDLSRTIERMVHENKEVTSLLLKTELKEKNAKILSLIESNQELHEQVTIKNNEYIHLKKMVEQTIGELNERNQALTTHNETLADCVDASNNKISSQNDIINSNIESFKRKNNIITTLHKEVHSLRCDVSRQKRLIKENKSVLTHPFKHTSQVRRLLEQGKAWEVKAGKRLKHIKELERLIDNKNKYILELKFPHKQDRELGSTLRELEKGGYI